ncbi:MAG TPA: tRNA (N6-threonylcarbamoyladenosine(37)-N6)-methyltransferase TrmO [Ohtaekwangia sp.]|uniref:tRNA (N6-threonylcarbamoyladenosine(37)-N6)-methyltransferase TrmO n=1 Tax=Ohtaekwangia sp. TaxID=2066019 RepID=UPI002F920CC8
MENIQIEPIGFVRSPLKSLEDCPLQGYEGKVSAIIEVASAYAKGLQGISVGSELILLTWLHAGNRSVLTCYPRNNISAPHVGVFSTRSPDRPNPVGLHPVTVTAIVEGGNLQVYPLEVLDGTPVIDIKPVINAGS